MVYSEISREGYTKEYLHYYEWPLTMYKGVAMTGDEIEAIKNMAVSLGKK
jgi:hypothetical protein